MRVDKSAILVAENVGFCHTIGFFELSICFMWLESCLQHVSDALGKHINIAFLNIIEITFDPAV